MTTRQRRHLAILTLDFAPDVGGVQTYLYEIARRLTMAYEISVVTPVDGGLPPGAGIRKVSPSMPGLFGFWRSLSVLQPDHVLVGHAHPQLLIPAALHTRMHYSTVTYGNDYLAAQQRWHRPFFNWLVGRSRPLITITHANAKRLQSLGLQASLVIHPGTDPERFVPAEASPEAPLTLLTVGRLVPRKGIDTVLRALPALLPVFPQIQYHIAGTGPDRPRLEELAQTLDVADAVTFLGRVADEVLPNTYRQATIFVMPAREEPAAASIEGFGIVYLEAGASDLPVVAGRSGGAVEAVRDGETGILVPPDDPTALATVLRRLLEDADLRRRLGRAGRQWVETEMNWDRAAREMQQALSMEVS